MALRQVLGGWFCIFVGFLMVGCATGPDGRVKVSYQKSAEENFNKGKQALEKEDYLEAIEFFQFVKSKFPYSSPVLKGDVDVLLADCYFGRERYIEAADAYAGFVKLYPNHNKVPYAMYRIALCYMNRMPDDWWFAPPAYELDQEETENAVFAFERYLSRYPDDENIAEAKKVYSQCKKRLADRTHYLMHFYRKREQPRGVLWRAEELLGRYAGLGFEEEALFHKTWALVELKEIQAAKAAVALLKEKFPDGKYLSRASRLLLHWKDAAPEPQSTEVPK